MSAAPKPRARSRHLEDDLQRDVMTYLRAVLPSNVRAWHTPNGGNRSVREAGRLKAQGVLAGVSDVLIVWRDICDTHIVAIELKSPTGVLTDAQKDFLAFITFSGGYTGVARSIDDVRDLLRTFGVPTRETRP